MTSEEVGTALKTDMTDKMIAHRAQGMITLRTIIGVMIEVPPTKRNLKPRNTPKEDYSANTTQSSRVASVFGEAKLVDTATRGRGGEERVQKEQKLQRQWDEPKLDHRPWERHKSGRSEETQERERSRTGSESSQTGASATSGRSKSGGVGIGVLSPADVWALCSVNFFFPCSLGCPKTCVTRLALSSAQKLLS